MQRSTRSLIVLFLISTLACSVPASHLESNRDPEFVGQFYRIFLIITHVWVDQEDAAAFADEIVRLLHAHGVVCEAEVLAHDTTSLGLDLTSDFGIDDARFTEFNPDGIMVIQESGVFRRASFVKYRTESVKHDVSLYSPPSDKRAWRAKVESYDKTLDKVTIGAFKKSAGKIVDKLIEDKLINSSLESDSVAVQAE